MEVKKLLYTFLVRTALRIFLLWQLTNVIRRSKSPQYTTNTRCSRWHAAAELGLFDSDTHKSGHSSSRTNEMTHDDIALQGRFLYTYIATYSVPPTKKYIALW